MDSYSKAVELLPDYCRRQASELQGKAVEELRMAISHIQNTAPAPPAEMAATTPTRLPMPTRVAVETISA